MTRFTINGACGHVRAGARRRGGGPGDLRAQSGYRTGPFASTGIPLMNGQADYMTLLNERDGGIGGVPVDFEECETGYSTEKGVECYERTKADAIVTQPWSTGITLQVLPRPTWTEIPILAPGYGFRRCRTGKVFQWAFNRRPATGMGPIR